MKTCFKCQEEKPRSEFYGHSKMADGLLGKCKDCTKRDSRKRFIEKRDEIREYDKQRFQDPERKLKLAKYRNASRKRNGIKYKARVAVNNAIRDKRLSKTPCEVCGNVNSEAHHDDYTKPLEVRWLCFIHHREAHGQKPVYDRILSRKANSCD